MPPIVAETISVENQIGQFFHNYSIGTLLRQCNIRKEKGIPMEFLFQFLLVAFTGKKLFRHMEPSGSQNGISKMLAIASRTLSRQSGRNSFYTRVLALA